MMSLKRIWSATAVLLVLVLLVMMVPLDSNTKKAKAALTSSTVVAGAEEESLIGSSQRKLAATSDGHLHIVYDHRDNNGTLQIYHAESSDSGVTWAEEQVTYATRDQNVPSLAVDSHDNLHLTWQDGTLGQPGVVPYTYYQERTTTWQAPELVASYAESPSIAIDGNDNVHIVYNPYKYSSGYYGGGDGIRWRERTAAGWQPEEVVSQSSSWVGVPAIAIDGNNNIHVAWECSPSYYYNVDYRERTSSGWGTEVQLNTETDNCGGTTPSIAIDSKNNVHVFWYYPTPTGYYSIRHREFTTSWQPIEDVVGPMSYELCYPSAAIDSQDHIHMVWSGKDAGSTTYRQIKHIEYTTSWQPVEDLTSSSSDNQAFPSLMWALCPTVDGVRTNVPQDGCPLVWMDGTTIRFYGALPPSISTVSPSSGTQRHTLTSVTITGTCLTGATSVTFGGLGITVNGLSVSSATQITASITISSSATTGARDVSVTTPGGTATLAAGFTVNPATLPSPANGSSVPARSVTFQWKAVAGAQNYRLVVSTSSFVSLSSKGKKLDKNVGNVTSYVDTGYPMNGKKYYWWVWAIDADGNVNKALVARRSFYSISPTGTPKLVSPVKGAKLAGNSVTFQWNAVDGAVDYRLVVSTNSFVSLSSKGNKLDKNVGNVTSYVDTGYPMNGKKYYWWVWAIDANGSPSTLKQVAAGRRYFYSVSSLSVSSRVMPALRGDVSALYVWSENHSIVRDSSERAHFFDCCRRNNINTVWMAIDADSLRWFSNAAGYPVEEYTSFIQQANARGIAIHAMLSSAGATVLDDRASHKELVLAVLRYNKEHPDAKFAGIHFDIENVDTGWSESRFLDAFTSYMRDLKTWQYDGQTVKSQGLALSLYLDQVPEADGSSLKEWLDYVHEFDLVEIQAYQDTLDSIIAKEEANHNPGQAALLNQQGIPFIILSETNNLGSGRDSITFWEEGLSYYYQVRAQLYDHYKQFSMFKGFGIEDYGALMNMT